MKTVYLLPLNVQDVKFSFDKSVLEKDLIIEKGLPYQGILEVEIEDALAEKLQNPFPLSNTFTKEIPSSYYEKTQAFIDNPPDWFKADGPRIYIIFDMYQRCFWSPSGNNINGIYKRNSNKYLTQAIRVGLTAEQYIQIYSYFDWACDSF